MPITNMPVGVQAVMLPELDFPEQLSLMRELGLTHYALRPRVIAADQRDKPYSNWGNHKFDLTPQRLVDEAAALRRQLDAAGIVPFGTVPSASIADADDVLTLHLRGAAEVGAGRVRINPPPYPRGYFDYPATLDQTLKRYEQVITLARPFGQKIVIETHCRSLAASPALAWNIVRHFDPQDLGVIFDLPNFAREGQLQPGLAVSILARHTDHLHVGGGQRVSAGYDAHGCRTIADQFCPLSESDLNFPTWLKTLREAGVAVPLMIEEFTPGVPAALRLRQTAAMIQRVLAEI
ncbi:MAG: TIM barrel protein [Phycisphaeraceae bacterium]